MLITLVPRLFIPDLASQFWKKSEKKVLDDFAREMVPTVTLSEVLVALCVSEVKSSTHASSQFPS